MEQGKEVAAARNGFENNRALEILSMLFNEQISVANLEQLASRFFGATVRDLVRNAAPRYKGNIWLSRCNAGSVTFFQVQYATDGSAHTLAYANMLTRTLTIDDEYHLSDGNENMLLQEKVVPAIVQIFEQLNWTIRMPQHQA